METEKTETSTLWTVRVSQLPCIATFIVGHCSNHCLNKRHLFFVLQSVTLMETFCVTDGTLDMMWIFG